jgi:putative endonuclease
LIKPYYIYILQCADNSFYTGATSDLSRRVYEHEIGADRTAYTYSRRPVKLVWAQECLTREEALRLEHQIKGWSRTKKAALVQNDYENVHEIVKKERQRRELKSKI